MYPPVPNPPHRKPLFIYFKAHEMLRFDTQDSLYDLAWSETHENQVLVAAGDGSVKLFDIGIDEFPIQSWKEHMREVFAVHWNLVSKDTFCSSSWDGTIRVVRGPLLPTSPNLYSPNAVTVEPQPPNLPLHPPHPFLHLLGLLLPPLTLPPLVRLQRLAVPPLRPPHPRLRLQPPRPHDPHPLRPSAHPALLDADTRPGRSVPAKRSPHARLEQIPLVHSGDGRCGQVDQDVRYQGAGTGTAGRTSWARLRREEGDVESASLGYFAQRKLRYDLSSLDGRECQSRPISCPVRGFWWRTRPGVGKDEPAYGVRVWGGLVLVRE